MALYRCIGNGGAAATDITPSNSTPASMSADGVYHATAAGYAIASYNSVTPSNSTPVALTSGDIDKIGGAGYAIESYSNVTPSDSSPVSMSSGSIYKVGGAGYAIESEPTSVTPSNAYPVSLTSGNIVKLGGNGYAIKDYSSLIPSAGIPKSIESSSYKMYQVPANTLGYVIMSYSEKTPDDSNPPSVFMYDIIRIVNNFFIHII